MKTMTMHATASTVALCVGLVLISAPVAYSDQKGKKGKEHHVSELAKDAKVTIEQAIKTATDKMSGTVVEAELEKEHGKTVWEVEILGSDGSVTEVHIDAADGSVIDMEKKGDKKGRKKD
ncbi:hypothetical protein YTPLAS18_29250 [Nitrospira sp.]|nr:hypothetical protein YTPLAS18_29250 [Nitrospira sp.]